MILINIQLLRDIGNSQTMWRIWGYKLKKCINFTRNIFIVSYERLNLETGWAFIMSKALLNQFFIIHYVKNDPQ